MDCLAMDKALLILIEDVEKVIKRNMTAYFRDGSAGVSPDDFRLKKIDDVPIKSFIQENQLSAEGIFLLLLAILPHIEPVFLDGVFKKYLPGNGEYPEFGGVRGKNFRGLLPTGQTLVTLLAGSDLAQKLAIERLFSPEHLFAEKRILRLEEVPDGEPRLSGKIVISQDYLDLFTTGTFASPGFSMRFPAQLLKTEMEWEDLVLNKQTLKQIDELKYFIRYGDLLIHNWSLRKRLKPGFRVLFHGPPGTGKTLTASLLGKLANCPVYRVDLSMVVSKFIGETEKNLANLFAKAENKKWILFFDEADALFGKRTNVRDAHDKYANQEVAYLLQRVENYDGLVILASNFKNNIDDAFMMRFQSVIHFPKPDPKERFLLWEQSFPEELPLDPEIDLVSISKKYDLTGANIINIVQYCCLEALGLDRKIIGNKSILNGIRKEFLKEGRIMS
ncbi:MAG: ATP-binding protein [Lewinella sp.]|nr:ATP-binding protein [Lewinella sp.]